MSRFELFGPAHLAAIAATAALATAAALIARRRPDGRLARALERGLAALLLAATALYIALELIGGTASVWSFVPLHLCDAAIFLAAFALLTRNRLAAEVLYFWAFAGTALAIVTPDVDAGPPARAFFFYFGLHAGVVIAAARLAVGARLHPRRGAVWRAWLVTNAYAGAVLLINLATGANFLYLSRKPPGPTPLDWFGPWPVYILVAELVALGLFTLLALPWVQPSWKLRSRSS